MNYMDLYNACASRANKNIDELRKFLFETKKLLFTESKWNGITTVEVEYFIDDDCMLTDVCGTWEFNDKGFLIE